MSPSDRRLPYAILWVLLLLELAVLLVLNDGLLVFTLDDPYIHLAFAENLRTGHFGLNPGELSAPSSSFLWPLLLAPFTVFRFVDWIVLVANAAFATGTLWAIRQTLETVLDPGDDRRMGRAILILTVLAIPAMNLVGLVFTGMEHSLQVYLSALLVRGIVLAEREGSGCPWLMTVAVLGPLVRYENAALSLAAIVWLWCSGDRRRALTAAGAIALVLGGFSVVLLSMDLTPIPTSILAKSVARGAEGLVEATRMTVWHNLSFPRGVLMTIGVGVLAVIGLSKARSDADRRLAMCFAGALFLHLTLGRFGHYHRYGIYALLAGALVLIRLWAVPLRRWMAGHSPLGTAVAASVAVLICCSGHLAILVTNPLASHGIYLQQFQMHRFATEFLREPLAANDIGWVTYRNDNYVLDLIGLASVDVLRIRSLTGADLEAMEPLISGHGIRLVMIYDSWFPGGPPPAWRRLGELRLRVPRITPAEDVVAFYAVSGEGDLAGLLRDFAGTLPRGAVFVFDGD